MKYIAVGRLKKNTLTPNAGARTVLEKSFSCNEFRHSHVALGSKKYVGDHGLALV